MVASDAHSVDRPPLLSDAAQRLSAVGVEPGVIEAAIDIGPERVLEVGLPAGASGLGLRSPRQAA